MSVEEFTAEFGEITPDFDRSSKKPNEKRYAYYHPQSQCTFHLRFEDGTLRGYGSSHGSDEIDTGVIISSPKYLLSESVRALVLSVSCIAWIVILVLLFLKPIKRAKMANTLLILACTCVICWFLSGGYSQAWRGIRSNDGLGLGVFMLILSLGILGAKDNIKEQSPNTSL
jgi:hypothetical protein